MLVQVIPAAERTTDKTIRRRTGCARRDVPCI